MPITKRKRNQVLTNTKKKTPEKKELLVKKLKQSIKKYQRAIVFQYKNLSTNPLKEIQQAWKADSKLFIGKNKVMQVGLGRSEEQSATKNSYLLSPFLKGETGLLLTNKTLQEIQEYCDTYKIPEYARAGHIADETIVLKEGIDTLKGFAHSIEPYLRKLGLNTQLINQQIVQCLHMRFSKIGHRNEKFEKTYNKQIKLSIILQNLAYLNDKGTLIFYHKIVFFNQLIVWFYISIHPFIQIKFKNLCHINLYISTIHSDQIFCAKTILNEKFVLTQKGKPLTVEQTKLLRLMDQKLAYLEIAPLCVLEKNGTFKKL